jgi:hypothetical protein
LNHRAANSLYKAKQDQLENILRETAEKRANGHDTHARTEHFLVTVDITQPATDDAKPDARHLINDKSP